MIKIIVDKSVPRMEINKFKDYQADLKKISKASLQKLKQNILLNGFCSPVYIWADKKKILDGHQRLKAVKELLSEGETIEGDIPYVVINAEDDKAAARIVLSMNSQFGEVTEDGLKFFVDAHQLNIADMKTTLNLDVSIAKVETFLRGESQDTVPEGVDKVKCNVKMGDLYELGDHLLMCGDSTSSEDVGLLMLDQKADMMFTDPPWNVNYGQNTIPGAGYKIRAPIENDNLGEDFRPFINKFLKNVNLVAKEGMITYIVMSAQEWGLLMEELSMEGYHWSSTIIWKKNSLVISRKDYHTQYEPIWYGWKEGKSRIKSVEDRTQSDVWDIDRPSVSKEHPTMKPIQLCERAINNSSKKGSNVIDLFGGSGSTLIACENTERRCKMMELSPEYCQVIINRWEKHTGKRAKKL